MAERLRDLARTLRAATRRREARGLALLGLASVGSWTFIELADEVAEGSTKRVDEAVLLTMRNRADPTDPLGPRWFEETARDFTALGGIGVLALIVGVACAYLLLAKKRRAALFVFAAVAGGQLLSSLFKRGFDRPRPDLVPHGAFVYTTSFPSGHSMMAAVTYLTLGALLARMHDPPRLKLLFLAVAAGITVLVGASRVYLGVHWPTDVLAGWAAGAVWAIACWLVALGFQRRGAVETSVEGGVEAEV